MCASCPYSENPRMARPTRAIQGVLWIGAETAHPWSFESSNYLGIHKTCHIGLTSISPIVKITFRLRVIAQLHVKKSQVAQMATSSIHGFSIRIVMGPLRQYSQYPSISTRTFVMLLHRSIIHCADIISRDACGG